MGWILVWFRGFGDLKIVYLIAGVLGNSRTPVTPERKKSLPASYVAEDVFHGFIAAAPVKIHSGSLQPRPEWGGKLEPGGAGPKPESSIRPRLFRASAGRHQTSDEGRSIARVGYEAGDRIVPSRQPGAGASCLRSAAAARLERGA